MNRHDTINAMRRLAEYIICPEAGFEKQEQKTLEKNPFWGNFLIEEIKQHGDEPVETRWYRDEDTKNDQYVEIGYQLTAPRLMYKICEGNFVTIVMTDYEKDSEGIYKHTDNYHFSESQVAGTGALEFMPRFQNYCKAVGLL